MSYKVVECATVMNAMVSDDEGKSKGPNSLAKLFLPQNIILQLQTKHAQC